MFRTFSREVVGATQVVDYANTLRSDFSGIFWNMFCLFISVILWCHGHDALELYDALRERVFRAMMNERMFLLGEYKINSMMMLIDVVMGTHTRCRWWDSLRCHLTLRRWGALGHVN